MTADQLARIKRILGLIDHYHGSAPIRQLAYQRQRRFAR